MTGEEAIKAAEQLGSFLESFVVPNDAEALRVLVRLARTGLLVERGLSEPGCTVTISRADFNFICLVLKHGILTNHATAPTKTAAVEAALKGTP